MLAPVALLLQSRAVYLKCALVGFVTALVFPLVGLFALLLLTSSFVAADGSGGLGAMSVDITPLLPLALAGFATGFFLTRRRIRRRLIAD
jgi:hypothetical protein